MKEQIYQSNNNGRIKTLDEDIMSESKNLIEWARILAKEDFVLPRMYRGKPELIFLVAQRGQEIGLKPMESVLNIVPMNEHLCMKGELLQKMIMESGAYEAWQDKESGSIKNNNYSYTVKAKRKGGEWMEKTFSFDQYKRAGLYIEPDTYEQFKNQLTPSQHIRYKYPERTIQYIARGWLARDLFPDVLKGLRYKEEVEHYMDYNQEEVVENKSQKRSQKLTEDLKTAGDGVEFAEKSESVAKVVKESLFDSNGDIIIKGSYTKEEIMSLKGKNAKYLDVIGEAMDMSFGGRMTAKDKREAILKLLENGTPISVDLKQDNPAGVESNHFIPDEAANLPAEEPTNKFGINVPKMAPLNPERDLGEALDLKQAIQNYIVEDDKKFMKMISNVPVQDDIPFKSMIDFCRRCHTDEVNKWLNQNFV